MHHAEGVILQAWFNDHKPAEDLIWKNGLAQQVIFVRDKIHMLITPHYDDRKKQPVRVVGEHTSKSVTLPVFSVAAPGLELRLRYNFHNWVVSVSSTKTVPDNFYDLFTRDHEVHVVYAEGFTDDWVFPSFKAARPAGPYHEHQFTVSLTNLKEAVWTFVFLLTRGLLDVEVPSV